MKKKINLVTIETDCTGRRMAYVHQIPRTDNLTHYTNGAELATVMPSYRKAAVFAAECNAQFREQFRKKCVEQCGEPIKFRAIAVYD